MFFKMKRRVGVWFHGSREKYPFLVDYDADIKVGDVVELDNYSDFDGNKARATISNLSEEQAKRATKSLRGTIQRTGKQIK